MTRLVPILLLVTACGGGGVTVIPESDLPEDIFGSPSPSQPGALPERGIIYLLENGRVRPIGSALTQAGSLPEALVSALLSAVPPDGLKTAVPANTQLIGVDVSSGVAAVDLTNEFELSAPSRVLALRVAQVVYTITEAPGIIAVRFSIEGRPAAVLTGNEQVVDRPVARTDYLRFAPPSS